MYMAKYMVIADGTSCWIF